MSIKIPNLILRRIRRGSSNGTTSNLEQKKYKTTFLGPKNWEDKAVCRQPTSASTTIVTFVEFKSKHFPNMTKNSTRRSRNENRVQTISRQQRLMKQNLISYSNVSSNAKDIFQTPSSDCKISYHLLVQFDFATKRSKTLCTAKCRKQGNPLLNWCTTNVLSFCWHP